MTPEDKVLRDVAVSVETRRDEHMAIQRKALHIVMLFFCYVWVLEGAAQDDYVLAVLGALTLFVVSVLGTVTTEIMQMGWQKTLRSATAYLRQTAALWGVELPPEGDDDERPL